MKKDKRVALGDSLKALIRGKSSKSITKSTGQNEGTAADGGNLVQNNLLPDILSADFLAGTIYSNCKIFNIDGTGAKIPIAAESTRNASGIRGGVLAYWVKEGVAKTPSTAQFSILDLGLNKAAVVIAITDELKNDSSLLGAYVSKAAQDAIAFLVDRAIVYGSGSSLNGIAAHVSTGFSAISAPITAAELKDCLDKYYGGKDAKWVMGQDLWVEVGDLWDKVATQAPGVPLTFGTDGTPYLWGYEVIVSDVMSDRSFVLGDFSQYAIVQKEIQEAVNESLKFVEDESYFRFVVRINGSVLWNTAITTTDGSTVHPFVMKTADEQSSSSSSSSSSSEKHSSSSSSSSEKHSSSSSSV